MPSRRDFVACQSGNLTELLVEKNEVLDKLQKTVLREKSDQQPVLISGKLLTGPTYSHPIAISV
jgi:hypothetical protein